MGRRVESLNASRRVVCFLSTWSIDTFLRNRWPILSSDASPVNLRRSPCDCGSSEVGPKISKHAIQRGCHNPARRTSWRRMSSPSDCVVGERRFVWDEDESHRSASCRSATFSHKKSAKMARSYTPAGMVRRSRIVNSTCAEPDALGR